MQQRFTWKEEVLKEALKKVFVIIVLFTAWGCATTPRAPLSETGEKIEIHVLSHRGDAQELTERQYKHRNEVGSWMEKDLLNMLRRAGYEPRLISGWNDFNYRPGRYLLEVWIDNYHAGSSAARMTVGYGAGAASLENSYALYGEKKDPLLTWSDGVGTSQHWTRLPRRLNQNTVQRLTKYLSTNK